MNSKISYHQQVSYCGKPRCKRCREGVGHGPYWYAYQTVDGRTTRTYIGKHLSPEIQAAMGGPKQPPTAQEAEREQSTLRIYTLGQFRLERRNPRDPLEWQTVTDAAWQHQRVRALLGCLVSVGGRKLTREQIMEALWPDLEMEMAASRLDRSVYSLRQLFEPTRNRPATSPLLLTEREVLVLADHPQIWIDADAFETLINRANESKDVGEKESLLREAASLYAGPFLPEDTRNSWTRSRRETLQRSWIGLLLDLADLQIARESLTSAIDPLDRLLSIDPTNEAAVQRLMGLLAQLGRRGEALRAYKRLHTALQQQYHIVPLPETRAIYDALRAGRELTGKGATREPEGRDTAARALPAGASGAGEPATVQIGRAHQSPLVGREQELEHLTDLVKLTEQAAKFRLTAQKRMSAATLDPHRRPQCVLLMGDVGIGKTRLAEEMSRDAKRRGWAVAWSRVYAQEGTIPYRLWIEVLRKAMVQGVWQRQEINKRPVVFQSLSNLLPELQEQITQVSYPTSLSPEQEQLRLWEAVKELLILISEGTPLLIALDDLQWADSSSCELLAYLARRTHGYPIVIVCTCRDMELPQDHPLRPLLTDLRRENAIESLALEPLSADQIASLVTQVTQVPEPMVQRISTRAAGNPFFAEELARSVETEPTLAETLISQEQDALPDTIHAVLTLRLGRLSQDCQNLLKKAAVLGSSFEFQVISAMEESGANYDEDAVLELIEEALKSGMLTEEGTGTRVTYSFWHPLLASHLYEQLSAARRANQHRRAAEVFKKLYAGQEEEGSAAATITHHLVQGGADPKQIVHYAELAGNRAFSLSSYSEAEKYYRITLEYMGNSLADWQHLSYILELLAECTRIQGKEEALRFYEQSLNVRQRKNANESSINPLQEVQLQAILWSEIAHTWYNRGDLVRTREYSAYGEKVLREAGVVEGSAWAYLKFIQGYIYWREGNYNQALQTASEAFDLLAKVLEQENRQIADLTHLTRARRTLVGDPVNLGRTHMLLSLIKASMGRSSDGLPHLNKALTIFEQYDCTREIAIFSCNIGDIYLRSAEYTQAQAALRRSFSVAERMGDVPLLAFVFANLALLDSRIGSLIEAESEFRKSIMYAEHMKDPIFESWWSSYLAIVLQEQGKLDEAKTVLWHALKVGRNTHVQPCIGSTLLALGYLRLAEATYMSLNQSKSQSIHKTKSVLNRAKRSLQHALTFNGLEADARIEARLALAQTHLLLHEVHLAYEQGIQALEEACASELTWHITRARRISGSIFAALEQFEKANKSFEEALHILRRSNMRLEYARTLRDYGIVLLQYSDMREEEYQRGLNYLQEALQVFEQCKAELDLRLLQVELVKYEPATRGA